MPEFDVAILGGGNGGYACALRAAQLGLSVGLIEKGKVGGTCLHIGCIPTKALLESAAFVERVRHAQEFGIGVDEPVIDYARMAERRDQVVKRLWTGLKSLIDKNKVTWIQGKGRLDGPRTVRVQMAPDADNPGGERVLQG
ncbi:MAG: FAD-dependent oxidoreductase, partial [Actinomycetota bacterium]